MIIGGIDAYKYTHRAVVLSSSGVRLADQMFPAASVGYRQLHEWMSSDGVLERVRIESAGTYAGGPTRHLLHARVDMFEVNMPHP